jgi:peroxiredoxin Q/BCP
MYKRSLAFLALFFISLGAEEPLILGDDAPEFYLPDQEGFFHSLRHHRGQYVLLFFYPRDFSPFSKRTVKAFERAYQDLKAKNVVIYGISDDATDRHLNFHETFRLTYDLLSDKDEDISKKYGARGVFGKKFVSCLIGPDGRVFRTYENKTAAAHPFLALADLP